MRLSIRFLLFASIAFQAEAGLAVENLSYQVLDKQGDFEIRQYPDHLVAEVTVSGDFDEAGNRAFRPLFNYISGQNAPQSEIAMTAPVNQIKAGEEIAMTAPVNQLEAGIDRHVVQFVMPEKFTLDTLPQPTNQQVQIKRVDGKTLAAIQYSGFWSENNYKEHEAELMDRLREAGLQAIGQPIYARYNGPLTPWFLRRNEVLVEVREEATLAP